VNVPNQTLLPAACSDRKRSRAEPLPSTSPPISQQFPKSALFEDHNSMSLIDEISTLQEEIADLQTHLNSPWPTHAHSRCTRCTKRRSALERHQATPESNVRPFILDRLRALETEVRLRLSPRPIRALAKRFAHSSSAGIASSTSLFRPKSPIRRTRSSH
jgi:hypothetical protein